MRELESEELDEAFVRSGRDLQEQKIFEEYPVHKAVASMVLPTIASQIIFVIYNLADTWYVGLTGDANAVAAVSLCLPVYTILSAISNLFGIGGAAAISRALGRNSREDAKNIFALSLWGALIGAAIYTILILSTMRPLLALIGGDSGDTEFAVSYLMWTVVIGGIPTILAPTIGHLIRAGGFSKTASFYMILGAVINIGFDPLFMFVILPAGNEVTGAAVATALANLIALAGFVIYLVRTRHGS